MRSLEAAIGSDMLHHIVHLPYRFFETTPSAAVLERVRQTDQLRQFLTGHLPLLIVDLAFVGLFLAVMFALAPLLALVTAAAMPVFAALSVWCSAAGDPSARPAPGCRRQGHGPGRGRHAGAHRQVLASSRT